MFLGVKVGGASVIRLDIHVVCQVHEEGLLGCLRARLLKHPSKALEIEVHTEAQVGSRCSRISILSHYLVFAPVEIQMRRAFAFRCSMNFSV